MKKRLIPELRQKVEKALMEWVTNIILGCTFKNMAELTTDILGYLDARGFKLTKREKNHIIHHINQILDEANKKVVKCIKIEERE